MNDKQQEQNFPSSSIIKDVDNKFHQLLKETVHDFLFQPLGKKTCTNPIISNLLMHEVKVSTSQQQPRTSGLAPYLDAIEILHVCYLVAIYAWKGIAYHLNMFYKGHTIF